MEIAIIAGTEFDTALGVTFIEQKGHQGRGYPISATIEEQSKLQILHPDRLADLVEENIIRIKIDGICNVMVYCNSLSAAVNMDELSLRHRIKLITPLHVYKSLVQKYSRVGVLAANCQTACVIEKLIKDVNPKCCVIGIGILSLVKAIEEGRKPHEIVETFALKQVMQFFGATGREAVILGCTHFPYILKQLKEVSTIPIIDPALPMLAKLLSSNKNC